MNKFTPGPWKAEYDDNGFFYIGADGMPSPYIVATGGEGETDKANANLAASAPELHEICSRLYAARYCINFGPLLKALEAALAKANGEVQS